jgi:adenylate cyclase
LDRADGERRLAAILSADVAGYSRLMGDDEAATVRTLSEYRDVFRDRIASHHGRVVDAPGDNLMAEFASPVEAVEAAAEIQHELGQRNEGLADHRRMDFRIGLNLGDVLVKDDALYGDGVNIAARLEGLAEPGGIAISGKVFDEVKSKTKLGFDYFGEHEVKNIVEPVRAYRVMLEAGATGASAPRRPRRGRGFAAAAAALAVIVAGAVLWQVTRHAEPPAEQTAADPALALPTGPSIAVLPFSNLSADPEQEFFSDGITEEIITALTRFPDLFVIARNSTFKYKGQSVDVREVGRDLGVRYVLEGSVRRDADAIRITAQLLETENGTHLWAETYDRDLSASTIFELQDEIAAQVVGALGGVEGVISRAGADVAKAKAPENLTAYDCVLKGYAYLRTLVPDEHARVRDCLEQAVETEPDYAQGWAMLASVYRHEVNFGYNPRPDPLGRSLDTAQRAIELEPANHSAHLNLALTRFSRGEMDGFFVSAERALELNSNAAASVAVIGMFIAFAGEWERGVALADKAMALNPDHAGWYYFPSVLHDFMQGNYEAALTRGQKINMPGFFIAHSTLASIYGQLGRQREAQASLAKLLKLNPDYADTVWAEYDKWNFPDALSRRLVEGLRKAGLDIADRPAPTN